VDSGFTQPQSFNQLKVRINKMGNYYRKTKFTEYMGNRYDEIIEVTAPTFYCIKDGKVAYVSIETPSTCLTKYERNLMHRILDCYNHKTPIPTIFENSFKDEYK
jgi:hypothetical protein